MTRSTLLLLVILAAFGAYSSWAMLQVGYFGIWEAGIASPGALQVLLDLVVSSLLICAWMVIDARRSGRNAWPYVAITLVAGSFGPLLYLLVGRFAAAPKTSYA